MIVDPDFLEHWKTRMLVDLLDSDEMAPLYLIRIWAHCQNRREWAFEGLSAAAVKAICRYKGDADKLLNALTESGFMSFKEGVLTAVSWDEYNASLIANWENGKRGGRPKKQKVEEPKSNPNRTQTEPVGNPSKTHGLPMENPSRTDKIGLDEIRLDREEHRIKESKAVKLDSLHARLIQVFTPNFKTSIPRPSSEMREWKKVKSWITESDVREIERFYKIPKSKNCDATWKQKSGVTQMLREFAEQIDIARQFNSQKDSCDVGQFGDSQNYQMRA